MVDEGTTDKWIVDTDNLFEMYKKYLHSAKECSWVMTDEQNAPGCFDQLKDGKSYSKVSSTDTWRPTHPALRSLVLADGMQVLFEQPVSPECNRNGMEGVCAKFVVDVNGAKKPNKLGRDAFIFALKKNGLHPWNCEDNACSTNSDCACKVLREGAMNY